MSSKTNRNIFSAVVVTLCLGSATLARASAISGSYQITYSGTSTDLSCASSARDNFTGIGSNSVDGADTIGVSACHNTPGALVAGLFLINDGGGNTATGSFGAIDSGQTTVIGGNTFTILFGSYQVTSAAGVYAGIDSGALVAETGVTGGAAQGKGFFTLMSTPEPASLALFGSALFSLCCFRRRHNA